MRRQWVEKNIDLALLREDIRNFFVAENFGVKTELFEKQYRILVKPQHRHDADKNILVLVRGNANNFEIEFSVSEKARSAILLGLLTTIVGGGRLVHKGLKSREALEKVEKKFWPFIEKRISVLTNTAKSS